MKRLILVLLAALWTAPARGQILSFTSDQLIRYTAKNPFERFPDGRPKVPDALLEKVRAMSVEEAWGILRQKGYLFQYGGEFKILHPGRKLVGRAVTAQYLPLRPDLAEVVDGTIRDLEGIAELPTQIYFKAPHPAAVGGVMIAGINIPVKVGEAIVMPGDVVLGDRTGVIFIPPHLVQEIVDQAEITHIHDEWTKAKFLTGKYKASELYPSPTSSELKAEYEAYLKERLKGK